SPSFTLSRTGPTGRSCRLAWATTSRRRTNSAGWTLRPTPRWIRPATSFSATPARITSVALALSSALPSGDRFAASIPWASSPGFAEASAKAWLTHRTPRAITTRAALPTDLGVAIAHRRRRDIDDGVLVPESIVAVHLSSRIRHPRCPVDNEHVGIAPRLERKRYGEMSTTRHIGENDVV